MALRIRLRQQGCTNNIVYRVVVADSRSPRDGKYVECIGWYNPCAKTEDQECLIQQDRLSHWLSVGAQITPTVEALVKKSSPHVLVNHASAKVERKLKKKARQKKAKK